MLDSELHISTDSKACLVSMICPKFENHNTEFETKRSLVELRELLRTLGVKTGSEFIQQRKTIDPASMLGKGKLKEIAIMAQEDKEIDLLVFDFELTASQIRNIKKITGFNVVDRVHVILEIFAKHAHTKESKIQIEISRLQYLLPRLAGFWSHLGRQRGGIGVKGGEGEQQIELDRRIVRQRIEHYKKELKEFKKSRIEQKKKRNNKTITAALVGHTNAGKSSLMNRLCRVNVLEEDKLFATLDSTFRMLNPDTHPPMLLIDTVGFISNLPSTLIEGFKTTLESALEADLLIIVVDISDSNWKKHLKVTEDVLSELKIWEHKEKLIVFNKIDLLKDPLKAPIIKRSFPGSFIVSANEPNDMNKLRSYLIEWFLNRQESYDLFIPYDAGPAHSTIASKANVKTQENHEKGIFYQIRIPDFIFKTLGLEKYILGPEQLQKLKKDIIIEF